MKNLTQICTRKSNTYICMKCQSFVGVYMWQYLKALIVYKKDKPIFKRKKTCWCGCYSYLFIYI